MKRLLVLAAAVLLGQAAIAQTDYPSRPVKIVLPFAAGGGTDAIARLLGQQLSTQMGVPVVIENRPGANGNLGTEAVVRAAPDGYTLLFCTMSIVMNKFVYPKLTHDFAVDLIPVTLVSRLPLVLVASKQLPARNLADFISYAKANPDRMSYASSGLGGPTHLASVLIQKAAGILAAHVPYRGGGPAMTDLLAGSVQFYIDGVNAALPFIKDDRVTALAVTSRERIAEIPNVPTVSETISPGFDVVVWQGVMAPAGTPSRIVDRIVDEFRTALAHPDIRARLLAQSTAPVGSTQQEFRNVLVKDSRFWAKVIAEAGVKLD